MLNVTHLSTPVVIYLSNNIKVRRSLGYLRLVEEVCSVCYRFLESTYDKKRMKTVKKISEGTNLQCKSIYHKKLTDSFKS